MKICTKCSREYGDEMNFCLEDGAILYSADQTLSDQTLSFGLNQERVTDGGGAQTNRQRYGQTGKNFSTAEQPTHVYPPRKSHLGAIIASVIIGVSILSGVVIYGIISRIPTRVQNQDFETVEPSPKRSVIKPLFTPQPTTDKVKIEVGERVKGGFNQTFVKCLVTNDSESVIELPRISLTLYKNDLKIGNVSGESGIKYLKPNQTVPIWINLYKDQNYTAARTDESAKYNVAVKDINLLYPNVIYTETKMTSEALTSLLNFRPYKEIFYKVSGTVENRDYEILKLQIYTIFYNDKSEIVGITKTNPPDLKKGEKAQFEASMGDRSLFGVPTRFELIAIDDSRTN